MTSSSAARVVAIANQHRRLRIDRVALISAISALDAAANKFRGGCPAGELSLVFVTDQALAKLHDDFLQDPTETDVITFAGDPAFGVAGEICVSADAAVRQTATQKTASVATAASKVKTSAAVARELLLYVVHGWLHLAGYDDLVPAKKRLMRRAEARAMTLLEQKRLSSPFRFIK